MADIAVTKERVATVYSDRAEVYNHIAGVDLDAGNLVTLNATGGVIKADANDSGANTFRGVALQTVKAGMPVAVLYRGHIYGFTIAALNVNAPLYVSDEVGLAADAAGTKSMIVGYVSALSDKTKVLYVNGFAG
jgi:predicted transcriptional regulator